MGRSALSLAATAALFTTPASAATITRSFAFTATDFFYPVGGPASVDPATGRVTVTFDTAFDQFDFASGVTFSGNFAPGGPVGYTYLADDDLLVVGTLCGCGEPVGTLFSNRDAFGLGIVGASGVPMFAFFGLSEAATGTVALADQVSVAAVPEPATWLAMIAGFGLAGTALRRRPYRLRAVRYA